MSTKYKIREQDGLYFITFAVVGWIDVFTRRLYKDLLLDVFKFCVQAKGLRIHAYVIMSNHVHLIISRNVAPKLENIIRDLKKYSSYRILKEIKENPQESRKEWMLYLFSKAGQSNSNNKNYQFWRQDNHPIELDRHTDLFQQKLEYIHHNPVKAGWVEEPSAYVYSSASSYEGRKGNFEIEIL